MVEAIPPWVWRCMQATSLTEAARWWLFVGWLTSACFPGSSFFSQLHRLAQANGFRSRLSCFFFPYGSACFFPARHVRACPRIIDENICLELQPDDILLAGGADFGRPSGILFGWMGVSTQRGLSALFYF